MKELPKRYADYFMHRRGFVGPCKGDTRLEAFICKRCGLAIAPNTLGAQSHIAKHRREVERQREKA